MFERQSERAAVLACGPWPGGQVFSVHIGPGFATGLRSDLSTSLPPASKVEDHEAKLMEGLVETGASDGMGHGWYEFSVVRQVTDSWCRA